MTATVPLMQRLKESTRPLHDAAEGHPFQHALAQGTLAPSVYAAYLAQLYLVHSELESGLKSHAGTWPAIQDAVTEEQFNERHLAADLERFGLAPERVEPIQATKVVLGAINGAYAHEPLALLGFHYVLLGSKHGGKFIARTWEKKLNLGPGAGCSYFDPYGPNFMEHWKRFVNGMNEASFSETQAQSVLKAAETMFRGVGAIGAELYRAEDA